MAQQPDKKVLALSGGVGGAKLALGLANSLSPQQLLIVANTGDDFTHLGLHISPDIDTVTYTLAGLSNQQLGWGLQGESWQFMEAMEALGGETWFRLGDRDLATHIRRSQLLAEGKPLSEATRILAGCMGITHPIVPMTDQRVSTKVMTDAGELDFQHYFVREQCQPTVSGFRFDGIENARPAEEILTFLRFPELSAIVICPSNPYVSIDPILKVPGMREVIEQANVPVVCVSPIVGGMAIKGPAAKMMQELAVPSTALAIAEHYAGLVDGLVIDTSDEALAQEIERAGMKALVTETVMQSTEDKISLAEAVLDFAALLKR
jgi:LPPG:FO 2-phospho-L-lactate transferase